MIRNFFVAKNVLWKKVTYTTNIEHIPEMKGLLNEAFFGVFKTNLTRYMRSLFNEKTFQILIESPPQLHWVVNHSNKVKKGSLKIEINKIEKNAETLFSFVIHEHECKEK